MHVYVVEGGCIFSREADRQALGNRQRYQRYDTQAFGRNFDGDALEQSNDAPNNEGT